MEMFHSLESKKIKSDWKPCLLEVGKVDELDFRVEIRAIQLLCRLPNHCKSTKQDGSLLVDSGDAVNV